MQPSFQEGTPVFSILLTRCVLAPKSSCFSIYVYSVNLLRCLLCLCTIAGQAACSRWGPR